MLRAGVWGFVSQSSLLLGALVVHRIPRFTQPRVVGLVLAFGAGTLISAVAIDLALGAYEQGGAGAVAGGLLAGAFVYLWLFRWLEQRATGIDPTADDAATSASLATPETTARGLSLAIVLDGVPESIAVGLTLIGHRVSLALVGAVFISNVPESIGATASLLRSGHAIGRITLRWLLIAAACGLAALVGFVLLRDASGTLLALTQSFAAGAILVMLATTMIPTAYEEAGHSAGLYTVFGFGAAFLLSAVSLP